VVSGAKEAKTVTSDCRGDIIFNSNSVSVGIIGCVLFNKKVIQGGMVIAFGEIEL